MQWITSSWEETKHLGKEIASSLRGGDILVLYGEMGAGKTTLTKGIAEGLHIKKDVTSPTFGLMNVYELESTTLPFQNFVHIDTYRLKNEEELIAIGVEEYLGKPESVVIIEWPEKVEELLKEKKVKKIFLEHTADQKRKITMT